MTKIMLIFGKLSLDMMYRTCGTQVNIDYTSEKDFSKKFFVVNRLTPVTIALFANSGIVEKNKSGYYPTDPMLGKIHIEVDCQKLFF